MADRTDKAPAPLRQPGVDLVLSRLTADLERVLGKGTEFCLVVAQDTHNVVNVQAISNTTADRAHQLLRAADGVGFDVVN